MEKTKLDKRLDYARDRSNLLLDHQDNFRSRRLMRETLLDLCKLVEELNGEIEKSKGTKGHN